MYRISHWKHKESKITQVSLKKLNIFWQFKGTDKTDRQINEQTIERTNERLNIRCFYHSSVDAWNESIQRRTAILACVVVRQRIQVVIATVNQPASQQVSVKLRQIRSTCWRGNMKAVICNRLLHMYVNLWIELTHCEHE